MQFSQLIDINHQFNLIRFFKSPQKCHFLVTNNENFVATPSLANF